MKEQLTLALYPLFLLFSSTSHVGVANQSFADQFLGSPLLILASIIVIDVIVFIYHKIRK